MDKFAGNKTVIELKRELRRVMEALEADDDGDLGITDSAIQTLRALKELKLKQSDLEFTKLKNFEFEEAPLEFRCPISGILMENPVVAASGQTFEELSVKKWLKEGNTKCPQTAELLPHTILIPNLSIKKMIMNWCISRNNDVLRISPTREEEFEVNATQEHLVQLLEQLSSSLLSDQIVSMRELRFLTARFHSIRALFGEIDGAISRLLSPVLIKRCYSHPALYEDVVITILNVSIDNSSKTKILRDSPLAISFLSEALRSKESETRAAAAAGALSSLSTLDSNKIVIGESSAFKPLIKLLEEGHPVALKEAAWALLTVCTSIENRERALSQGAITVIIDKIVARVLLDEMLEILSRFSSHQRAVDEMEERGMISCLVSIAREDVSEHCKENCVAIVYAMCFRDPRKIYGVEGARETLSRVAKTGTSRAKRKASGLLERMNRFAFTLYTA